MAYRLIEAAQTRWRAVNAPHLAALVRAGTCSTKANCSNDPSTSRPPNPADQPKRRSPDTSPSTGLEKISETTCLATLSDSVKLFERAACPLLEARPAAAQQPFERVRIANEFMFLLHAGA